jgi:segregation and condensation protein A
LVKQLLEYEKFKEIAQELRQRKHDQQNIFKRPKAESQNVPDEAPLYFEASIFDLITAFTSAMEEVPKELFYEVIKEEFSIEDKIHKILHLLLVTSSVRLGELFAEAKNKLEIIVTFLSILELIRLKEIAVFQRELFGEIEITRNKENIIPYDGRDKAEEVASD